MNDLSFLQPMMDDQRPTLDYTSGSVPLPGADYLGIAGANDPKVKLRQMIAGARAQKSAWERSVSETVIPTLLKDQQDAIASRERIQAQIQDSLEALRLPMPTPGQPGLSTSELQATGIASVIAPRHASNVLSMFQKLASDREDQSFDVKLKQYGLDRQTTLEGLKWLQEQYGGAAKSESDARSQMIELTLRAAKEADDRGDKAKSEAFGWRAAFYQANSEAEVRYAARMLRETYPDYAPTPQEEMDAVRAVQSKQASEGLGFAREWRQMTTDNLKYYGGYSEDEARYYNETLKPRYEALAGVPLEPVKSGETMAKEIASFNKSKWEKQFAFAHTKEATRLAEWKAEYELSKKRLSVSERNSDIAGYNSETSRMNALRLQFSAEYKASGAEAEYNKTVAKIAEIEAKGRKAAQIHEDTAKYEIDLAPLYQKRESFVAEFGEFTGFGGPLGMVPQYQMNFPNPHAPMTPTETRPIGSGKIANPFGGRPQTKAGGKNTAPSKKPIPLKW